MISMEVEASHVGGGGCSSKGSKSSSTQGQMEEEVSHVSGGGCSSEGSKSSSTQGRMQEEVQKISAKLSIVGIENEGG